jgi:hypothetical protein
MEGTSIFLLYLGDCDDGEVGGMNGFGRGNRSTQRKTAPDATLSTTNPTCPDPGANPGRRGGKPSSPVKKNFTTQLLCFRSRCRGEEKLPPLSGIKRRRPACNLAIKLAYLSSPSWTSNNNWRRPTCRFFYERNTELTSIILKYQPTQKEWSSCKVKSNSTTQEIPQHLMGPEKSIIRSQHTAIGPYLEPDESSTHPPTVTRGHFSEADMASPGIGTAGHGVTALRSYWSTPYLTWITNAENA